MTNAGAAPDQLEDRELFEEFTSADQISGDIRDPWPEYAERRATNPVWLSSPAMNGQAGQAADHGAVYQLYRFEDCDRALRDAETFSSGGYEGVMGVVMGHTILEMDAPEHLTHRGLVAQAFRPKVLRDWERDVIVPVIDELIDAFVDRGRAELVAEFTARFPILVIASMLGLPREDHWKFLRWSLDLISVSRDWDRGVQASNELSAYFGAIVADRRANPRNDLISQLVRAELDDHVLVDEEILPFLKLLLPAGAETTYRSTGNLLFGLLGNPVMLAEVRADRSLVVAAIEEALRWEPPLHTIIRRVTSDVELSGVMIPAGSSVVVNLGAANRDPSRWDDPDTFDIHRPPVPHLAFASGPHTCLGMHLARAEMRVALETLLDRLPNLRLEQTEGED
ncbi:MAG: cytochrome P450, partial [Nitriliruptorales bacterium]|nr:cytochrome P450 [Nitriliruptorales bacterium]